MATDTGIVALGGLDGVELKVNFAADQIDDALGVFGLTPAGSKPRQIWFGEIVHGRDGPEALPLLARGVIVRVRAKKGSGDSTVKLRVADGGVDVREWQSTLGTRHDAKIEGDWASRRLVSASLNADVTGTVVDPDVAPARTIAELLSAAQRAFAKQLLVPLDQVELLGPISARKWEPKHDGDVAAELWEADTLRFLEVSLLVTEDPDGAMHHLLRRAADGGLVVAAEQEPKTTTVLRELVARIR